MAVSSTRTLLSLDRFFAIVGMNPLHANQVYLPSIQGSGDDSPPTIMLQYAYLAANRVGREEVAQAISTAEDMIAQQLGYLPKADWVADELVRAPRPANPVLFPLTSLDLRSYWNSFKSARGFFISGGREAKSVIQAAAAIVYTDTDGDGYAETATITAATTVTDIDEIALYYPAQAGADEWEIRPLRSVVIAGGIATIVCRREQLVLPNIFSGYDNQDGVDGADAANFLTTVDVYRHYTDPASPITFMWESLGSYCDCGGASCASCGFTTQGGCLFSRDARLGYVAAAPATWDAATAEFTQSAYAVGRGPDRARIWYRSGWCNMRDLRPLSNMDPIMERAIAYYALTFLDYPLYGSYGLEDRTKRWREDLAENVSSPGQSSSYNLTNRVLECPLGTTRGAVYAWQVIRKYGLGEAVTQ